MKSERFTLEQVIEMLKDVPTWRREPAERQEEVKERLMEVVSCWFDQQIEADQGTAKEEA